jgi:hypothetical protein
VRHKGAAFSPQRFYWAQGVAACQPPTRGQPKLPAPLRKWIIVAIVTDRVAAGRPENPSKPGLFAVLRFGRVKGKKFPAPSFLGTAVLDRARGF